MPVQLDAGLNYNDARLGRLLDWWRQSCAVLGHLPGRQHFDPMAVPELLPSIYMVDVVDGGERFRWRLLGTELNNMAGRDATGRYFDELYSPAACADVALSFSAVLRSRLPLRSFGSYDFAQRSFVRYEAMEVPLAEDGQTVDIVLGIAIGE